MNEYTKIILTTSIPLLISFTTNFVMIYFKNRNIPNRNEIQKKRLDLIYQPLYSKFHNNPKIYEDQNEMLKVIKVIDNLIQKYPLYVDESTCNYIRKLSMNYDTKIANKLIVNIREEHSYLKDSLGYPSNYLQMETAKMIYFLYTMVIFSLILTGKDIQSLLNAIIPTSIAMIFSIWLLIKLNFIKRL